jgi:glycosyltransferase involved in cell wall biosynthesis
VRVILVSNGTSNITDSLVMSRRYPHLIRLLTARGVEITTVLARDDGSLAGVLAEAGARVEVLGMRLPRATPATIVAVRRLLRSGRYDIGQGDEAMPAVALGTAARLSGGPPVVYRRSHLTGGRRLRAASRVAAGVSSCTAVTSEEGRSQAIHEDRVAPARVHVVRSGVIDLRPVTDNEVAALRARFGIADGSSVVGVVARLRPEKAIDVAIAAVNRLAARRPEPVHLLIVGSGPEEERLRALAVQALHARIHVVGHQNDLAPWYAACNVLAVPSHRESFSQVVLEIAAAGKPVVASRTGGLRSAVLDGVTGVLVPPGDADALAEALRALIDDPASATQLGTAARAHYEARHTVEHMAEEWLRIWSLVSRAGPKAG